jgi:DNA (cytosine-5)-methyltransferase 1
MTSDLSAEFDKHWLESSIRPKSSGLAGKIRIADLFAGCGGLSLGIQEAARALNLRAEFRLAVDLDQEALSIYGANFPDAQLLCERVEALLDGELGAPLTTREKSLRKTIGSIDIVIGGPPCQGHSALNNHTRHTDDRNELYLRMARFCEVFKPDHVVIENVPGVLKDKSQVAQRTWVALEKLGYVVESQTINSYKIGVAQSRKRNITIASKVVQESLGTWVKSVETQPRNLKWAIGDLVSNVSSEGVFDSAPKPSSVNQARINFLFDKGLFDLPDEERPDCHRLKVHSYNSVYGRLSWDKPSQTVTTGFGGMGRGRYVHPSKRRTITPHEAARIQFFPDFFKFPTSKRTTLQMIIGNAVPPKLGYVIGLHLLR